MKIDKKYILANELTQKMNIHIANISNIKQELEEAGDFESIIKMNNCSFIDTTCKELPKFIKQAILKYNFTDVSNKLPCTFAREELGVTDRELKTSGIITGVEEIAGKKFYVFNEEFLNKIEKKVTYILDKYETEDCSNKKEIDGFIKLTKNKFLVWY
jgi:hypothetical protein